MSAAVRPAPEGFAWTALRDALADRLRREVAAVALLAALALALATSDALVALPQASAALALLLFGARVETPRLGVAGRILSIGAALGYALLPGGGDAARVLARFLAGIAAATLVQPKDPREQGLLLATTLLQVALAAASATSVLALPMAVAFAVLSHRALATFHRLRAVRRVEVGGGVVLGASAADPVGARRSDVAAFACVALAAPLFLALPRVETPMFGLSRGHVQNRGIDDQMNPGRLASLDEGDERVGTVAPTTESARGCEPYFRVVAYDSFDGRTWRTAAGEPWHEAIVEPSTGRAEVGGAPAGDDAARFEMAVEAGASSCLPVPEGVVMLAFHEPRPASLRVDGRGIAANDVHGMVSRWSYEAVAPAVPYRRLEVGRPGRARLKNDLGVPDDLRAELAPFVAEAVGRATEPRAVVDALVRRIASTCSYSLRGGADGDDVVADFLLRSRVGHCEHFASALAVCARVAGVPARVVAGWHASRWNSVGDMWVLRRRDAHAWVECYLPEGWARFDATPPEARGEDPYRGVLGWLANLADAVSFEWSRRVLGYDASEQREAAGVFAAAVGAAWTSVAALAPTSRATGVAAASAALAFVAWRIARRLRLPRAARGADPSLAFYREALAHLARTGLRREPSETPSALLERGGARLPASARDALATLTAAFEARRYGGAAAPEPRAVASWLAALRESRPAPPA